MTKRIDWEKEQLRQKLLKNREVEHKWHAKIQEPGEWKPLEAAPQRKKAVESLSRRHQKNMRRLEILRRLREISVRVEFRRAVLGAEGVRALSEEARTLVKEASGMEFTAREKRIVSRARVVFGLSSEQSGGRQIVSS